MILIQNLCKAFGHNQVLKGINLCFERPGITAILGPNGSGKTTLIKTILGMVIPDKGEIYFNNVSIRRQWKYRHQIAYLSQIARFPENLQVRELIAMMKDIRPKAGNEDELIGLFDLQPFLNKRLGILSGGTRQKVNLVLTFMYDCPVIIMDEPTAGLDPVALVRLRNLIEQQRQAGKIILVTTHVMNLVEELSDEVVYLLEGNIYFQGSVSALKTTFGQDKVETAIAALLEKENHDPLE